jgi:cellulose synthase/poly-beta-1,6-N-acetylglucosamine synthase-like glycosyltransferase
MQLFGALYLLSTTLLAIYGINLLAHVGVYWWQRSLSGKANAVEDTAPPLDRASLPMVTVQLPIYNERHVAARLVDAVAGLDWPVDRLHIQVLDDSTDDTTTVIAAALARYAGRGWYVEHVRRPSRMGYKAGALQHGLASSAADFVAIFDADFIPPADFLRRLIPSFANPAVACVQARWGHLNAESSGFTQAQALGFDGHFIVEKQARQLVSAFIHFNGSAGVWRRVAIDAAGGWRADTLTEDLDLSYRVQLAGWRIVYRADVVAPAELPVQVDAFKRQQHRWAKGSMQTAVKLLGPLWRAPQPLWRKVTGTLHLTNYLAHPLMLLNLLLMLPASRLHGLPWVAGLVLGLTALAAPLMYLTTMDVQGLPWPTRPRRLATLILLGTGLSVNNTRGAFEGLASVGGNVFQRTPKFAAGVGTGFWQSSAYALPRDPIVWAELGLAAYAVGLMGYFVALGAWGTAVWPLLYVASYGYLAGLSLIQARRVRQAHARLGIQPVQS